MKPKILITLGDSWTEGVGAYNPPIIYDIQKPFTNNEITNIIEKNFQNNIENFHNKSWCNIVGKKLNFDKVFNLGRISASNSENLKILNDFITTFPINDYDILVIWLMTEPSRFSFYIDGSLKSYQPSFSHANKLAKEYTNEIKKLKLDTLLEQKFYVQMMESFCKSKEIDLIITSWHETFVDFYKLYHSKNYLHKTPIYLQPPNDTTEDNSSHIYYSFCSHPNENGYEWIAKKIIEGIKENHSKWYTKKENEKIETEWRGFYQHEDIFNEGEK